MRTRPSFAALVVVCLALGPAAGRAVARQRPGGPGSANAPGTPGAGRGGESSEKPGVEPVDKVSTTAHTITIDGKPIAYTANAGTMVLRNDDGKPKASVFYIAYTADKADAATRPITFFFNGGPGAASIWLDMGIMGPRHPRMGAGGAQPAPPYDLVDNPDSPIDVTDLVQVDAMLTGYSRPGPGVPASDYTGGTNDIAMFAHFIRNYLDKYDRWASPKYLFGESYGTFRSAGLASALQEDEGIELNGIMLLGTVLDFQYISPSPTNDIGYATFLPTYTATAWYHKKLPAALQTQALQQVVQQSRDYAFGDYLVALAKGNTLTAAERSAVAARLSQLTGLSARFIESTNLRVDASAFRTELLRDQRLMLGRYDTRLTGINGNASTLGQDYDPAEMAASGAFMTAFMRYLHDDLKYSSDLQYYIGGHAGPWDYSRMGRGYPSTVESLRLAMAKDPYLHVMVGAAYYDSATPFANAEYTFRHLGFDQTYPDRVQFKYYESGHMAYLNPSAAKHLKADIAGFITSTEHPAAASAR